MPAAKPPVRNPAASRARTRHVFARLMEGATEVKCSEFASAIVDRL